MKTTNMFLLLLLILTTSLVGGVKKRTRRANSQTTYKLCSSSASRNETFCNGNGQCLESSDKAEKFCSCGSEYFGTNCENKADNSMETLVFAVAIVAGVMLLLVIIISIELYRRKQYYRKMKRHYESKESSDHTITNMYRERKSSHANSIDDSIDGKFDLAQNDGGSNKLRASSFTPMENVASDGTVDVATEDTECEGVPEKTDGAKESSENLAAVVDIPEDSPDEKGSTENLMAKPQDETILEKNTAVELPKGQKDAVVNRKSPTMNNDDFSIASETYSTTESERNLLPARKNAQPLTDQEIYDQYLAQHMANQQRNIIPTEYIPRPHLYSHHPGNEQRISPTNISPQPYGQQRSPTNISPQPYGQQRSPQSISPSAAYNNGGQMFFHTMQPKSQNVRNLHPQAAGKRRTSASTSPTRFGPPSSPNGHFGRAAQTQQQQPAKIRHRSPNRAGNAANAAHNHRHSSQMLMMNNYSDVKGRPLSMSDLRVLEEMSRDGVYGGQHPGYDRQRSQSVENILSMNSEYASSEVSMSSTGTHNTNGRKKRPGMWAQTHVRT